MTEADIKKEWIKHGKKFDWDAFRAGFRIGASVQRDLDSKLAASRIKPLAEFLRKIQAQS